MLIFLIILALSFIIIFLETIIEKKLNSFIEQQKDIVDIRYKSFSYSIINRSIDIEEISICPIYRGETTIEQVKISNILPAFFGKIKFKIFVKNFQSYPLNLHLSLGEFLYSMGYKHKLTLNLETNVKYGNGHLNLDNFFLTADNFGKIELNCSLKNILLKKSFIDVENLKKISLKELFFSYNGSTFLDKFIYYQSQKDKNLMKNKKTDMKKYIIYMASVDWDNALDNTSVESLINFIENPKNISIKMSANKFIGIKPFIENKITPQLIKDFGTQILYHK